MENNGKYKLVKAHGEKEKIFHVTITGDSNDGDYISRTETYVQADFDEYVIDALIDLKNNYSESHQLENYPNENDLYIPSSDWGYCHTLESIEIQCIDENGDIWNVELVGGQ